MNKDYLSALPDELVLHIMYFMDTSSVAQCRSVNKRLSRLSYDKVLLRKFPHYVLNDEVYFKEEAYFSKELFQELIKRDTNDLEWLVPRTTDIIKECQMDNMSWALLTDATWYVARDAAWFAVGNAACNIAGHAGWHASWDSAWYPARYAACNIAGDAGWDAEWDAASNLIDMRMTLLLRVIYTLLYVSATKSQRIAVAQITLDCLTSLTICSLDTCWYHISRL
jgi:hypothetical protein